MNMEIIHTPHAEVVRLSGSLDSQSANELMNRLPPFWDTLDKGLIYDMAHLQYMNSDGLRLLVVTAKTLSNKKLPFAICNLSEFVTKIIDVSMFSRFITVYATEEEALNALASGAPPQTLP